MQTYRESHLPETFAHSLHEQVRSLITQGQSFTLIGMDSVGVSPFLRFVASQEYAHFFFLDCYELSEFTKEAFLSQLYLKLTGEEKKDITFAECHQALVSLTATYSRMVLIINKFDLLKDEFSQAFFGNFRTLCHGLDNTFSLLFSVTRSYIESAPTAIIGSNMHIFSRYVYFPPYTNDDVISLVKLHYPEFLERENLSEARELSGGHMQLLHLILRSDVPTQLLNDPYIRLLFKHILDDLTPLRKRLLKQIALEKETEEDRFLLHMGIVKEAAGRIVLFSPLLAQYLQKEKTMQLPPKEQKLFQLLKKSNGKILSKQNIFDTVWSDDPTDATDWALDAVIYRLRRHPYIKEKGYMIKSHKKLGYQLVKE